MSDKETILEQLTSELETWQSLITPLTEEQATVPGLPNGWSVKDLLAHLMAWQQVTRARLEAALQDRKPVLPAWLEGADPDGDDVDPLNARIYDAYRGQSWEDIYEVWQQTFRAVVSLGERLPENNLVSEGQYPWLNGYPLIAVLEGTYDHHRADHLPTLRAYAESL